MMGRWVRVPIRARIVPPAGVPAGVQAGDPRRVRPTDRAGRAGGAAAPGGVVLLAPGGVAAGARRRRARCAGGPGPTAREVRRAGGDRAAASAGGAGGGRAGQDQGRAGCRGKSARALGTALRERGLRPEVAAVTDAAFVELEPLVRTRRACQLLGLSRATVYRRRRPSTRQPSAAARRPTPPNALSDAERRHLLDVLHEPRFVDKAPAQVWATLLDDGVYLASISTMYRLLRERGETRERRRQATHPARVKPELVARAPNQVWTWDITKLKGPDR